MAGKSEKDMLSVSALQACPLVKQFYPSGLNSNMLAQHLRDPALIYQELDALCELDDESLRDLVRPREETEEECAPCAALEEPEAEEEEPANPQSTADCIVVTVDPEGLQAKITLIHPPEGVAEPVTRDMLRALYQRKISRGVRTEFITRLAERPVYDRSFRIAEAQRAVNGQDSSVTYHFNPSVDLTPRMAQDGTVDYRDIDFVKSVKEGELLCEITPATPGVDGMNIYGQVIPAMAGQPPSIRCGANTILTEDGREIRAACDGQVFLRGNTVEVSQILIVEQVDYSTGNIDFPGSVHILGDVAGGFTVRAGGDIVVNGVVDYATLISGGSIALCSGIKGAGSGYLEARQDIRTLFIESCKVRAGGSIYADTVLNSTVECGRTVHVFGKHGYLLGGVCVAGEMVSAVQIGNEANTPTTIVLNERVAFSDQDQKLSTVVSRYYDTTDRMALIAEEDARDLGLESVFPCELARIAILSQRLWQKAEVLIKEQGLPSQPRRRRSIQVLEGLFPNVTLEIDGVFAKNTGKRGPCTVRERQQKLYFTQDRLQAGMLNDRK